MLSLKWGDYSSEQQYSSRMQPICQQVLMVYDGSGPLREPSTNRTNTLTQVFETYPLQGHNYESRLVEVIPGQHTYKCGIQHQALMTTTLVIRSHIVRWTYRISKPSQ